MHPRLKAIAESPWQVALLLGLAALLLFGFNLGIPSKLVFDETHYVPAARALVELSAPRNTEHPLVAKELIALGMLIFGDNSFGWRFFAWLSGVATVVAAFALLWLLTRRMRPAVVGALLLMLDQLLFVLARIGMLDVFLGAFVLWAMVAMVWAMKAETPKQARWRWILGSALLGLAVGVKWAAVPYVAFAGLAFVLLRLTERKGSRGYAGVGLAVWLLYGVLLLWAAQALISVLLHTVLANPLTHSKLILGLFWQLAWLACLALVARAWLKQLAAKRAAFANPVIKTSPSEVHRRWPGLGMVLGLLLLGTVSIAVYFLTFLPAFFYAEDPLTLATIVPFQGEMYRLQTQILSPHIYQAKWWSWPLMLRPIWAFYEYYDGAQRGVLVLGNPLIMWGGLVAVIACVVAWFRSRAILPLAMALLWAASLAIYIVIPKSLGFYYYYHLSGVFLCLAIAVAFDHFDAGRKRGLEEWFLAASLLMFAYFYPIIAGMPLSDVGSFNFWMWFPGWR
jgi:4-amino-4-deoxy-L-arabinose transferase-like glycosyltransferase